MIDHVSDIILAHAAGAARTPVEAISVLDALPTHRAPSVLTAVLSRGFNEYQPSMAVKHGLGLALLPHYPRYILFDDIEDTLVISGACGDLLTIELLWQMAGPTTPCRPAWHAKYGILANAVEHGHLTVLEWVTRATRTAGVTEIDWLRFLWPMAATKGHAHILTWAIAQGHLTELSPYHVLLSTREGDPCIMDWWIASQPSKEAAMTELSNTRLIQNVTSMGALKTLDWWWENAVASLLPLNPKKMAMLLQRSQLTMMEWWLHVHIAAGCPFLLPPAAELARIFQQHDKLPHWWVHDAVVTRKIAVFVKSDSGDVVPYQPEVPLFLQ
ncbi:hypothetical protein BC828DRAFT_409195 [Blastocladiella britannica]|nr:hypothetical protein BC828DRAFT_409195 [Blastocladiella britannica]